MSRLQIVAVRGAVAVRANTAAEILSASARLLRALVAANGLDPSRIVSALFTTTADLDAEFPAHAARRLGWTDVPMLHAREIPVPGSMPRVVRVLITVRDVPASKQLVPVYLGEAAKLRPDLATSAGARPRLAGDRGAARRVRTPGVVRVRRDAARRIALIGLGQIGGSIGLSLAGDRGWHRIGWDLDARTLRRARRAGAVDESAGSLEAACAGARIAVIATPVNTLVSVIGRVAAALPRGAVLLDTGSSRVPVTAALRAASRRGLRAAGAHPLAGSEGRGFAAARRGLFEGATFAVLPIGRRIPAGARELLRDLGARVRRVGAVAHDRALARTSHLPYVLACALAARGRRFARRGLAGPGFRDMTRLSASDPRMTNAYVAANAREVGRAWREFRTEVERRLRDLDRLSRR